jgi:hypothetical protein
MLHHNHQLHTRDSVEYSTLRIHSWIRQSKVSSKISLSQTVGFLHLLQLGSGGGRCKGSRRKELQIAPQLTHENWGRSSKKARGGRDCGEMECVVVGSSSCCCSTSSSSRAAPCLPSGRLSCATFVGKARNSCPEIRLLLSTSKTQQRQERRRRRTTTTTTTTTTRCSLSGNGNAMLHVMTVHQLTDWLTKQGFPEQVTDNT